MPKLPTPTSTPPWLSGGVLAFLAMLAVLALSRAELAAEQRIVLRTGDGLTLSATWHEPSSRPAPAVILVHMLNRSRRDWEGLAARLANEGIGALTIDLRGHGESARSVVADPVQADYSSMVLDLKAARRYLAGHADVRQAHVGILGASLGANLAVLAAAGDSSIASLALLSPSLDYRGLRIEAAMRSLGSRPVLMVASDDDPYASRSARDLQKAGTGVREVLTVHQSGHGTHMLLREPDLSRALVDWFRRTLL